MPSSDRVLGKCQVTRLGFFRGSTPWAHLGRFELRCGMRHSMLPATTVAKRWFRERHIAAVSGGIRLRPIIAPFA